jgi:hypothetical protein
MSGIHWQFGVVSNQATSGGGGGGGGLITLNGAYFSDSAVSGAQAGVNAHIFRNVAFVNTSSGSAPYPAVSMTGTYLTGLSSPTISLVAPDETKSDYTLPASTLIAFLNAAQVGQTDPFTGKTRREDIFFNIGCFLQTPNGINALNDYRIDSVATTWSGIFTNFSSSADVGANWPLIDSLAISNTYPIRPSGFQQPNSGDWGVCGTGTLQNLSSAGAMSHILLADFRAKIGGTNPSAGQTLTVKYRCFIDNAAGQAEKNFHTVVITLT